jgi:hypothetical protein
MGLDVAFWKESHLTGKSAEEAIDLVMRGIGAPRKGKR